MSFHKRRPIFGGTFSEIIVLGLQCTGSFTDYPCAGDTWGVPSAHPGWNGHLTIPDTHDVGVVVLDAPVTVATYGLLPTAGYLDSLATRRGLQDVKFTVVGYGLQGVKPVYSSVRERYVSTVSLINLRCALTDGYNLHYSSDPGFGSGPGGTCFGDSGGPAFHEGYIVAVNSFVPNLNCKGAGFGYRVDTSSVLEWLNGFLG